MNPAKYWVLKLVKQSQVPVNDCCHLIFEGSNLIRELNSASQ